MIKKSKTSQCRKSKHTNILQTTPLKHFLYRLLYAETDVVNHNKSFDFMPERIKILSGIFIEQKNFIIVIKKRIAINRKT